MDYKQAIQHLFERYQHVEQKELDSECLLLTDYRTRIPVLAQKYASVKPAQVSHLTIPAIFHRSHDENFISDYLAYVLDPQKNGIGVGPLQAWMDLCGLDDLDIDLNDAIIRREYPLDGRRIDLLIRFGDYAIVGIENKIFSPESEKQTVAYAQIMDELFPEIEHLVMIFLTRAGEKPSSDKFMPISYPMLFSALKNVPVEHVRNGRKRVLWEDFLEHLEVYIMATKNDHFEFSEKAKLFIENQAMIHDLQTNFDREWDRAISYLETNFAERVIGGPWETVFQTRNSWQQAFKNHWRKGDLFIHFEWSLPFSALANGKMAFMIDVENQKAAETIGLFANRHLALEQQYQQKGILYCPPKRKHAIAFKEYAISQDINHIADVIFQSFEEFRFLEAEIDAVLAIMSKK